MFLRLPEGAFSVSYRLVDDETAHTVHPPKRLEEKGIAGPGDYSFVELRSAVEERVGRRSLNAAAQEAVLHAPKTRDLLRRQAIALLEEGGRLDHLALEHVHVLARRVFVDARPFA